MTNPNKLYLLNYKFSELIIRYKIFVKEFFENINEKSIKLCLPWKEMQS